MADNSFMKNLENATNYKLTENGGISHKTTNSKVYDMFAFGGAYRERSDNDCILLFKEAYEEDPVLALKCLFYLRDIISGQGERRFFRVCFRWLAQMHPEAAARNMELIPEYGRVDDLYCLDETSLEKEMYSYLKKLLAKGIKELKSIESLKKGDSDYASL